MFYPSVHLKKTAGSPTLEVVPKANLGMEMELPLHNEQALKQLRKEKNELSTIATTESFAGAALGAFLHPVGFGLFAAAYKPLVAINKIARIESVMTKLAEKFNNEEIQIFPSLKVGKDWEPIDLYIRVPGKTHILVAIRSCGDRLTSYDPEKKVLKLKNLKGSGGLKTWKKPDPIEELSVYQRWISDNRKTFGMSSREASKRPTAKVLLLWPPTKVREAHHITKDFYQQIGGVTTLAVPARGTIFVLEKENFVPFVSAWIERC